jgi:hypothetical protein
MAKKAKRKRQSKRETLQDLYANYSDYNKILRTWFVTLGLGGPALFLANPKLADALSSNNRLHIVIWCFLLGCGSQVLNALINKLCSWHEFNASRHPKHKSKCIYKFFIWLADKFLIEALCDLATFGLFVIALWNVLMTFTAD